MRYEVFKTIPASVVGTFVDSNPVKDIVYLYIGVNFNSRYAYTKYDSAYSSLSHPMNKSTYSDIDSYLLSQNINIKDKYDEYGVAKFVRFVGSIPNVNGIVDGYAGDKVRIYLDADNNYYAKEPRWDAWIYPVGNQKNIEAVKNQLADSQKQDFPPIKNDELSNKSSFEQFNDILQTTFLMALAGGAVYYFFFYNKKGKK